MSGLLSRRELVARARAAAATAAVSGVVAGTGQVAHADDARAQAPAATTERADGEVLSLVLSLELVVVLAYRRALDSGFLTPRSQHVVAQLLAQEHEHVHVVRSALRRLGTPAPPPPKSLEYAQSQLTARNGWGSFTDLHSENDCLGLLTGAEAVAQGAYYQALGTLSHAGLLRTAAQALASEAQHETVIEGLLHPGDVKRSVPSAFVEGIS